MQAGRVPQSGVEEIDQFGRLSGHLGYLLHRTDNRLLGRIAEALRALELTPARATAMVYIASHAGCDQMSLGRVLGINRASTMKTVNALVELGLVERRPGRDRRSNALHLTSRGEEVRVRAEDLTQTVDDANFSALDDAERAALRAILGKLTAAVPVESGAPPVR